MDNLLTLKGWGYFTSEKDGGAIMAPTFISARSNGKRLIFSGYKYFVNRKIFCKRV